MARNQYEDDDDNEFEEYDESRLVKDLRKQLKEALKAKDELSATVENLSKTTRTSQLKDVLSSKSLNPKLAAFYPSDGEVTPEAVDAWVTEYGDVFGIQKASEPDVDPAEAVLHQRINASSEVFNSSTNPAKFADMEQRIANATSLEELQKILAGQ